MNVQLHFSNTVRNLIGSILIVLGVSALYHHWWLVYQISGVYKPDRTPALEAAMFWLWPMSFAVILAGLCVLPPGTGRSIGRVGFGTFVVSCLVHALIRGLDFDTRFLWW